MKMIKIENPIKGVQNIAIRDVILVYQAIDKNTFSSTSVGLLDYYFIMIPIICKQHIFIKDI